MRCVAEAGCMIGETYNGTVLRLTHHDKAQAKSAVAVALHQRIGDEIGAVGHIDEAIVPEGPARITGACRADRGEQGLCVVRLPIAPRTEVANIYDTRVVRQGFRQRRRNDAQKKRGDREPHSATANCCGSPASSAYCASYLSTMRSTLNRRASCRERSDRWGRAVSSRVKRSIKSEMAETSPGGTSIPVAFGSTNSGMPPMSLAMMPSPYAAASMIVTGAFSCHSEGSKRYPARDNAAAFASPLTNPRSTMRE